MTVRTRFAPSPTGYLHLGGARTALFSWLYARHNNGKFVLRVEDTDLERSTEESTQAILDGMQWLGLDYDEGPFFQSQRMDRYKEVIQQLLEKGHAYKCYCSQERLENLREEQRIRKHKPRYDKHCFENPPKDSSAPHVIRFLNPEEGEVTFEDQVRGVITFKNTELDDLIIQRSDGSPTYNLCVVVDDADMQITHVIRGDDHINNTPRQINILHALGFEPPVYAHVPMILGDDGKRLSKRHGAVSVIQYHEDGYLPEAMLNCLVRLGWSHGDQELFSKEEMIKLFTLDHISQSAACFNTEKLNWINQQYLKTMPADYITSYLSDTFHEMGVDYLNGPSLIDIVEAYRERVDTIKEMAEKTRCYFQTIEHYDDKAAGKFLKEPVLGPLTSMRDRLDSLTDWSKENLHQVVVDVCAEFDIKMPKVAQPIRVALTGNSNSPSIDLTLKLMGKERTIKCLDHALEFVRIA